MNISRHVGRAPTMASFHAHIAEMEAFLQNLPAAPLKFNPTVVAGKQSPDQVSFVISPESVFASDNISVSSPLPTFHLPEKTPSPQPRISPASAPPSTSHGVTADFTDLLDELPVEQEVLSPAHPELSTTSPVPQPHVSPLRSQPPSSSPTGLKFTSPVTSTPITANFGSPIKSPEPESAKPSSRTSPQASEPVLALSDDESDIELPAALSIDRHRTPQRPPRDNTLDLLPTPAPASHSAVTIPDTVTDTAVTDTVTDAHVFSDPSSDDDVLMDPAAGLESSLRSLRPVTRDQTPKLPPREPAFDYIASPLRDESELFPLHEEEVEVAPPRSDLAQRMRAINTVVRGRWERHMETCAALIARIHGMMAQHRRQLVLAQYPYRAVAKHSLSASTKTAKKAFRPEFKMVAPKSKNVHAIRTSGEWAVQREAAAAEQFNSGIDASWDGTPFKITLFENMMRKLYLKLGLEALRGFAAIRRFRKELVDEHVRWMCERTIRPVFSALREATRVGAYRIRKAQLALAHEHYRFRTMVPVLDIMRRFVSTQRARRELNQHAVALARCRMLGVVFMPWLEKAKELRQHRLVYEAQLAEQQKRDQLLQERLQEEEARFLLQRQRAANARERQRGDRAYEARVAVLQAAKQHNQHFSPNGAVLSPNESPSAGAAAQMRRMLREPQCAEDAEFASLEGNDVLMWPKLIPLGAAATMDTSPAPLPALRPATTELQSPTVSSPATTTATNTEEQHASGEQSETHISDIETGRRDTQSSELVQLSSLHMDNSQHRDDELMSISELHVPSTLFNSLHVTTSPVQQTSSSPQMTSASVVTANEDTESDLDRAIAEQEAEACAVMLQYYHQNLRHRIFRAWSAWQRRRTFVNLCVQSRSRDANIRLLQTVLHQWRNHVSFRQRFALFQLHRPLHLKQQRFSVWKQMVGKRKLLKKVFSEALERRQVQTHQQHQRVALLAKSMADWLAFVCKRRRTHALAKIHHTVARTQVPLQLDRFYRQWRSLFRAVRHRRRAQRLALRRMFTAWSDISHALAQTFRAITRRRKHTVLRAVMRGWHEAMQEERIVTLCVKRRAFRALVGVVRAFRSAADRFYERTLFSAAYRAWKQAVISHKQQRRYAIAIAHHRFNVLNAPLAAWKRFCAHRKLSRDRWALAVMYRSRCTTRQIVREWKRRVQTFKHRRVALLMAGSFYRSHFHAKVNSAPMPTIRFVNKFAENTPAFAQSVRTYELRLLVAALASWRRCVQVQKKLNETTDFARKIGRRNKLRRMLKRWLTFTPNVAKKIDARILRAREKARLAQSLDSRQPLYTEMREPLNEYSHSRQWLRLLSYEDRAGWEKYQQQATSGVITGWNLITVPRPPTKTIQVMIPTVQSEQRIHLESIPVTAEHERQISRLAMAVQPVRVINAYVPMGRLDSDVGVIPTSVAASKQVQVRRSVSAQRASENMSRKAVSKPATPKAGRGRTPFRDVNVKRARALSAHVSQ
eukprot:TRINITY_DN9425_c0_g1_i1.p1 TRINITY_DN9425_c0_g1~~TRINITY_DN9425_c0_g1_i1.p1  ORF type:complete len:1485 (+),score=341.45 TRINITY_DN9425_c0_g1_i1:43-4497(+)